MRHTNSPVVRVAVAPKRQADLPKLVEALKRLSKSDPLVQCTVEETGQHVVGCAGELHMEVCLTVLQSFLNAVEIVVSPPVVAFKVRSKRKRRKIREI
jgi:elongation factor 2